MSNFDPIALAIPETVEADDFIVATYLFQSSVNVDIYGIARALSEEQTTGTWLTLPGETDVVRERHLGRVQQITEIPDHEFAVPGDTTERNWIIQIAYPWHNVGGQIPLMLTAVHGNISAGGRIKLVDLHFPKSYVNEFKGPRFGIPGVRELLGVEDRPLVTAMIKPNIGLTPEESAKFFYEACIGGIDCMKDDELVVSHPWSTFQDRVKLHTKAAARAEAETGQKTLYFYNVTDRPDRLVDNAKQAIELGANALMVNYVVVGISALSILADDPDINVPILAHLDFAGALYADPWSGISSHLILGKLPRLAGADVVVYPAPYGKFPLLSAKHLRIAQNLTSSFHGIKPVWPMPGGGVQPGMVPMLHSDMHNDFMVGAGGAVHGHPGGSAAGARALRQAIDSTVNGVSLREAAQNQPELATAINEWGITGETELGSTYELMRS